MGGFLTRLPLFERQAELPAAAHAGDVDAAVGGHLESTAAALVFHQPLLFLLQLELLAEEVAVGWIALHAAAGPRDAAHLATKLAAGTPGAPHKLGGGIHANVDSLSKDCQQ